MKKQVIIIPFTILVAIILVANLVSEQLYFRMDFTEDERYTLSTATKNILDELDEVITVTAYFSEDLPPQLISNKNDFEDILIEYEQRSSGNLVYEFINPNEDQTKEKEVQQKGIGPIMINVTENDRVQQMRAYMGAILQLDNRTEIIPLVQPGAAMEYELTTAVKKLSVVDKPKVAILSGNGEPSVNAMSQLREQLSVLYTVESYAIKDTEDIPSDFRAIAWIAPTDTIPVTNLNQLDKYLNQGGKLFIAYSNVKGDLQQGLLSKANDIGLTGWLAEKGVVIDQDFVIDAQCATVTVSQQQSFYTIRSQKEFPYFPRVSNFEDHPMTKGLDEMILTFATQVTPTVQDTSIKATPLVYTSELSGVIVAPTFVDIQKKWTEADFGAGVQSLAIALEGIGSGLGKMVVIGNGDFIINGEGQGARQVAPDHVNFASNAIDWLADDTGLIDLRTKGITSRPLDNIEDSTKNLLKYGNVFAPIAILLIYASVRRLRNQRRRQQWMQGNYE